MLVRSFVRCEYIVLNPMMWIHTCVSTLLFSIERTTLGPSVQAPHTTKRSTHPNHVLAWMQYMRLIYLLSSCLSQYAPDRKRCRWTIGARSCPTYRSTQLRLPYTHYTYAPLYQLYMQIPLWATHHAQPRTSSHQPSQTNNTSTPQHHYHATATSHHNIAVAYTRLDIFIVYWRTIFYAASIGWIVFASYVSRCAYLSLCITVSGLLRARRKRSSGYLYQMFTIQDWIDGCIYFPAEMSLSTSSLSLTTARVPTHTPEKTLRPLLHTDDRLKPAHSRTSAQIRV